MKILIASDLHWPTLNGVASFSRNLAQGLAARGHEVLVIAPSQTGKRYKEVDVNHAVYRTASVPFPFYQNFRISLTPQREVKKIIKEFDPDVKIIAMSVTGDGQFGFLETAVAFGARRILHKPFSREQLLATLADVIAG